MTSYPLFQYDVISDLCFVVTAKNDYIGKVIVISLLLNDLSSNLVQEVRIK